MTGQPAKPQPSPKPTELTVVVPLYRCADYLRELNERLIAALSALTADFEIIYVNDASPEPDWEIVKELIGAGAAPIRGFNLSRNWGQHAAIICGLSHARGRWTVVMDGDLQDRPEEIPRLYRMATDNRHDVVFARRCRRQDSWFKKTSSRLFYKLLAFASDIPVDHTVASFGIYHRRVVRAVLAMGDRVKFLPAMVNWAGFAKASLDVEHCPRRGGSSGYGFVKLSRLALNVLLSFSDKPLKIMIAFGLLVSVLSFLAALVYLTLAFRVGFPVQGWASVIISLWFSLGVIVACLGVVGIYVGKIFEAVKGRPVFLVKDYEE